MALYHKYRPKAFDDFFGNERTTKTLAKKLKSADPPHAFLFIGPTGCGKTTLARIVARELGCTGMMNLKELDSAQFRGIDTVRDIREKSQYVPQNSPCRVWIIDECHKLTPDAQNALLKSLEDPPSHVYFILCTTDPDRLIKTVKGRCSTYQVDPLESKEMRRLIRHVVKGEGETLDKSIYDRIAEDSLGHPRNALQILDQVLAIPADDAESRLEMAKKASEIQTQSIELCRALIQGRGWKTVAGILAELKTQDVETIRRQVLGYCTTILLSKSSTPAALIMSEFIEPFYNTGFPGLVFACYSALHDVGD